MNVILDVDDGIAVDDELKQSIIDAAAKVNGGINLSIWRHFIVLAIESELQEIH